MASINHYPARTQEQVFNCSVDAMVHGREPGFPYLAAFMAEYEDLQNKNRSNFIFNFQAKYPIYVRWTIPDGRETPEPDFYMFVRGEDSAREVLNWDHYYWGTPSSTGTILEHAYIHNLVLSSNDDFTGRGALEGGIRSVIENGVDKLVIPDRNVSIVNEGEHLGACFSMFYNNYAIVMNKDSALPTTEEVSPSGYVGRFTTMVTEVYLSGSRYYGSYANGAYGDYRVIYNTPFATMEEWFQYCKTH